MNIAEALPLVGASGFATWFGQALVARITNSASISKARIDGDVSLKTQSDKMLLEVMKVSQDQIEQLVSRVALLEPLQEALTSVRHELQEIAVHFGEAKDHIALLLGAETPEDCKDARRQAQAFLNRMRRLSDAKGVARNEAQIGVSSSRIPPDMQAQLDNIP